jgi:hypothetical protein
MQMKIHVRTQVYKRARWALAAVALSAGFLANPALALVYQDTDAQSGGLGGSYSVSC